MGSRVPVAEGTNEPGRRKLTLEMRGLLVPVIGLFYEDLTNRYMILETQGMKRAAELA